VQLERYITNRSSAACYRDGITSAHTCDTTPTAIPMHATPMPSHCKESLLAPAKGHASPLARVRPPPPAAATTTPSTPCSVTPQLTPVRN
jgi:hypothetical protein